RMCCARSPSRNRYPCGGWTGGGPRDRGGSPSKGRDGNPPNATPPRRGRPPPRAAPPPGRPGPARAPPPPHQYRTGDRAARAAAPAAVVVVRVAVAGLAGSTALVWGEREQTRQEKERADADRRLAREALDTMTSKVIADWLARRQ